MAAFSRKGIDVLPAGDRGAHQELSDIGIHASNASADFGRFKSPQAENSDPYDPGAPFAPNNEVVVFHLHFRGK